MLKEVLGTREQEQELFLDFVAHSADIEVGDLLVTSGLGGKYPEGYPVSRVVFVRTDESREFAIIYSEPVAEIDRLRYMLLLSEEEPVKSTDALKTPNIVPGNS